MLFKCVHRCRLRNISICMYASMVVMWVLSGSFQDNTSSINSTPVLGQRVFVIIHLAIGAPYRTVGIAEQWAPSYPARAIGGSSYGTQQLCMMQGFLPGHTTPRSNLDTCLNSNTASIHCELPRAQNQPPSLGYTDLERASG